MDVRLFVFLARQRSAQTGTGNSLQNGVEVVSKGGLGTWSGAQASSQGQLQNISNIMISKAIG